MSKTGVFWAFNDEQFDENKTHKDAPNSEYFSIGGGGYIHMSNKNKLNKFFKDIEPKLREEFISKIDINDLIKYELINHECYYTGDFSEVIDKIRSYYNMPLDEINNKVKDVYLNEKNKNMDDFDDSHIGI